MKKFSLICIIIVGIMVISGCISEEKTNSETLTQEIYKSEATNYQKEILQAEQESLMQIEHFIDPKLENQQIEIDNPNIEIVSHRVNDNRAYETDANWNIELVIQNNAQVPVWVISRLIINSKVYGIEKNPNSITFVPLGSGERKRYIVDSSKVIKSTKILEQFLEKKVFFQFPAFTSVKPKISPEFGYFEIWNVNYDLFSPPLDFNSIKFEIDENNWKYVIVEVTNPSETRYSISADLRGGTLGEEYKSSVDTRVNSFINPGESQSLKIPLWRFDPKDIGMLRLYSKPDKTKN